MPDLEAIAATIQEVAAPGAKPKAIIAAVRERHVGASRKDVVRAAFYALTAGAQIDPDKAKRLHALAIETRGEGEVGETPSARKTKRRKRETLDKG